jgi:hypothetical protein
MDRKLILAVLVIVLAVFIASRVIPFFFQTLDMDILNYDNVNHNVTVKIFSGSWNVFEKTYIVRAGTSEYIHTGLLWGEYVIEINLDGKVYKYKAKVEPSFRFVIGGSFISFKIKNSSIRAIVLSEGIPHIKVVEFTSVFNILQP